MQKKPLMRNRKTSVPLGWSCVYANGVARWRCPSIVRTLDGEYRRWIFT